MAIALVLLILSSAIILHLFGCGGKDRSRQAAGSQQNSSSITPKNEPKAAKAGQDPAGQASSRNNPDQVKSKMGDDGGYESCPDMTNSQLARAANT